MYVLKTEEFRNTGLNRRVKKMPISNDAYYKPEEALHELMLQERILNTAVDIQVLLRLLVEKKIITREEVKKFRDEVRSSQKYKPAIDDIQRHKAMFVAAKDNPQEYLRAIFKAKTDEN